MTTATRTTALVAAALTFSIVSGCSPDQSGSSAAPDSEVEHIDGLPVSRVSAIYKFDPESPQELADFSDEIFIGTVARKVETKYLDDDGLDPLTVYEVEVDQSLDGKTPGTTLVGFGGGVTKDGTELMLPEGDNLLNSDQQYLFAGRRMSDGTLDLVPKFGTEELADASATRAAAGRYLQVGER
ncbi:hypothetical protein [Aeromicrobium sp. P5_D10]